MGASTLKHGASGWWARAAIAICLFAFTLQSFVTQTHIHFASDEVSPAVIGLSVAPDGKASVRAAFGTTKNPTSPFDDPKKCPLCQEYIYAGNYVSPSALVLHEPSTSVSAIVPATLQIIRAYGISHSWHGRAPPLS